MDIETIEQELNKRFAAPLPEYYKRHIIVWYDEDQEFADDIDDLTISDAEIVKLTGTNLFSTKKLIGVDEPTQNFLIYKPYKDDSPENDWLLDVELYSEDFRADLTAIWMDEMGIADSVSFREQVRKYAKFFKAKSRREDVVKRAGNIDSPMRLLMAVLASVTGAKKTDPLSIIQAVLRAGTDNDSNEPYQEMEKYEVTDLFWNLASNVSGYPDGDRSLGALGAQILLSAGSRTLPPDSLEGLQTFYSFNPQHQAYCADIVSDWIHSDDQKTYIPVAESVEEKLSLRNRFMSQKVETLADTEVFPCIDEVILTKLMTDIGNEIIETDKIDTIAEKRRTMVWFSDYRDYYDGIYALARMQSFFKDHAEGFHGTRAENIWNDYTKEYYLMDTYYRSFHMSYENSLMSYNGALQDLFAGVRDMVERLYVGWFVDGLGQNWTEVVSDDLDRHGYVGEFGNVIPRQENFYRDHVKNAESKVYVIISDALRYEVAVSLSEKMKLDLQGKVDLSAMQGIFPTITEFGMAALLPHQKMSINVSEKGAKPLVDVLDDGQKTDMGDRDSVLKKANPASVALKAEDILPMSRAERSALVKGKEVVYIYHNTIDETAHHAEKKVFNACKEAISEIENLIRIIVNEFGGTNIFITADHGFLYTYSPLKEQDKTGKSEFTDRVVEYGRRFAIVKKGAAPEFLLHVKLLDGDTGYNAYAPRESIRIRTSAGSSMNFVHGGISLQEMCVPLISYRHLRNSSKEYQDHPEKYDTKPVEVKLLSANHRITNMLFNLNFYQKDAVGGNREKVTYNAYFVDSTGRKISDVATIIADKRDADAQQRTFRCTFNLKPDSYDSKEIYYLLIEQEGSTELPERIEFTIDIAFATDFGFFS